MTSAARMSNGWLASAAWKACAVPVNFPLMVVGKSIVRSAASIALTASPSATFGARLKNTVTEGNRPWWFTWMGPVPIWNFVTAVSGTVWPVVDRT